eukprot:490326-Heterocapsa_arctica.AAC.1
MEVGKSSASDARAVGASCVLRVIGDAVARAFSSSSSGCDAIPWAVVSKMHDATKLEVSLTEASHIKLQNKYVNG